MEEQNLIPFEGKAAGAALTTYEAQVGLKVVSSENYQTQLKGSDKSEKLPISDSKTQ